MAKHKPQKMFGAMNTSIKPPWVSAWTVRGTARDVRREVGRAWCIGDPVEGWRAAKKDGMRVVKIEIRAI